MNNSIEVVLWGRELKLDVVYQYYPGGGVNENQLNTLKLISTVDFSEALVELKKYMIKNNSEEIEGESLENIYRFVMPRRVLITRETEKRVFAFMCNYKFDMEHGLAIIFENERFKEVGPKDIIL